MNKTKTTKATPVKVEPTKVESKVSKNSTKSKVPEPKVPEPSDTDEESDVDEGDEGDEGDETEVDSPEEESQVVVEKKKETFVDLVNKLEATRINMKNTQKEINNLKLLVKTKEKEYNDFEKQCNNVLKLLTKSHTDEVNKVRKERPKRKGNVNGGFNKEHPVPEILINFLGLPEGTCLSRPKVMSALNNKFTQLGLKNGQNTTLDKATSKALKLNKEDECRVIKFTEFQSFLASFYPKKVVDVKL